MSADEGPRPDPRKLRLLVDLLSAEVWTYEDLAAQAELALSRRSLQLYVEKHLPQAGYEPIRGRTPGPGSRATFTLRREAGEDEGGPVNRAALALARGVLAQLFPIEGTDIDRRTSATRVLAIASGVPSFTQQHKRALQKWINAAESPTPVAVELWYRAAAGDDGAPGEDRPRIVWPLGVILRDGRRVYLPALVEPGESLADQRMYALERVVTSGTGCGVRALDARETPPVPALLTSSNGRPRLRDLVTPGFGIVPARAAVATANVHVRFDARQAAYVRGRTWHKNQVETQGADGGLELRFGPVEIREAVGWCSQWIDGIAVLGDDRLRAAYERSLTARLDAQRNTTPR